MKLRLFVFISMCFAQNNAETIKNACYFKVFDDGGRINNTRLLWWADPNSKKPSYHRVEYDESELNEEIRDTLTQQLIAIAFYNAKHEQIKLTAYGVYDNLLEKVLVKQLDPEASLPSDFDILLQEKHTPHRILLNDTVQTSYLDLCCLY